jgi:hypothetical protein
MIPPRERPRLRSGGTSYGGQASLLSGAAPRDDASQRRRGVLLGGSWYNPQVYHEWKGTRVEVIQKGYGEVRLKDPEEVLAGEITLHAEGWVAVVAVPPDAEADRRWFPVHRVAEVVWKKSVAMRR